jgi:hypothetical protein
MALYRVSQGAWNNNIVVKIITDHSIVKLKGSFIIKVYKDKEY